MAPLMGVLLRLIKFRISLLAALFAFTGFILASQGITTKVIMPVLAVFFLASGACALNQYQDRKTDGTMERTRGRPIPSRKLHPSAALWISLGFIFAGSLILFFSANLFALGLGSFAILWYNGVYYYLKRMTPFAAVPGALVGTIPPAIGWISGGGGVLDPRIMALVTFSFIWQVPHFWLILLNHSFDYEKAGLPSLTERFTTEQLHRIIFIWMFSTAVCSLSIPLFRITRGWIADLSLLIGSLWLAWSAVRFLQSRAEKIFSGLVSMKLNIYVLWVILSLSLNTLLH